MKNVVFLIITILSVISCTKEDPDFSSDKIIGTWGLYKEVINGTIIIVDYTNPNEQITYNSNGTWESETYGSKLKGTWSKLSENKYVFRTFNEGIFTNTEIEFIENNKYILKFSTVNWKYYRRV